MNQTYNIVVTEQDLATSVKLYDPSLSLDAYNCKCLLACATVRQLKLVRVRVGSYLYVYGSGAAYRISDGGRNLIVAYDNAVRYVGNDLAKVKGDMADSGVTLPYTVTIERILGGQ